MIKRICFFTVGFAFNRLIRMKYYEKIFPKDVEMFLFTTDKYGDDIKKWDLKRTKVEISKYNPINSGLKLRNFCINNKIDRIVNLGAPGAGIPLLIAALSSKADYLIGYYGEVVKHKRAKNYYDTVYKFFLLFQYLFVGRFAKKLTFTDIDSYKKASILFMKSKRKIFYSHAPVDTKLFIQKNKISARKKLNLPLNKDIIIRVGRINYGKCGDVLIDLVKKNKDKYFVLVGEWFNDEVPKISAENLLHIPKKSSRELVDYYNASDLCFCLHRHGNGIGITAEESLACGVPVILPKTLTMKESPSIIKTSFSSDEINEEIKKFFSLSKKERDKTSSEARQYAEKYCSDDVWKKEYIKFHLS